MSESYKNIILDTARDVLQAEAEAVQQIQKSLNGEFVCAVEMIIACSGKVILTGMGKSGIVAKKIAATLSSTGTPILPIRQAFLPDCLTIP